MGYYFDLVKCSEVICNLIKVCLEEIEDLLGEVDLFNQFSYSLILGLLYKYEFVLLYVVCICFFWCWYCYWFDFLIGKIGKDIVFIYEIVEYIEDYNVKVVCGEISCLCICEVLLFGGDLMVLLNINLFDYFNGLVEVGFDIICIGIKEMVFFLECFDDNFFVMLDFF